MKKNRLEIITKRTTYFFPLDRYYYAADPGHIWFKKNNSLFEVGFDYFGQFQAGTILHIRTRPLQKELPQGSAFGTVESDKWIGPLRLPLSSILVEINSSVLEKPQLVNEDPYEAWVIRIKPIKLDFEMKSLTDIISMGDVLRLKEYIVSELEKYEDPPI